MFLASLAVAGIAYLVAMRECFKAPRLPPSVLVAGLILAAVWHLQFLRMPPGPDDDIHRYVWDGRLQRLGYNPYLVVPSDPAARPLHTSETRNLNNPDVPSPYPPGAQLFFRAVTAIHESTRALKVAFVLCDFVIVFVLLGLLRRDGQPAHLVLAYAWNPLLAVEVAGSGHIDILGALLLLLSFAALGRRWRAAAAVTFGLAVGVKLLPVVLAPLYVKRLRLRDAALAVAVIAVLYFPFVTHGSIPTGSLGTYLLTFRFNGPVVAMLDLFAPREVTAVVAPLAGLVVANHFRKTKVDWSPDLFAWPTAASFLCAPVVYPWYLVWLLPFLRSPSTSPIMAWTVSIIPVYIVWHLRGSGGPWSVPAWVLVLEYGSIAAIGAGIALRRLLHLNRESRGSHPQHKPSITKERCR